MAVSEKTVAGKERVAFSMHHQLLVSTIKKQAGTLSKAVLEGVMNAVDAKASKVEVTLTAGTLVVQDDGGGFKSRQQILECFAVFGQPHTEAEGKTFGAFRMGRGQLFAYGANQWATGPFRMDVDVDNKGLDFDLYEGSEVKGCRIEVTLYKQLLPSEVLTIQKDLVKWCKYAPLKVILNGKVISQDPKEEKWDVETEDAYIRVKSTGSVSAYNLGIHVMEKPAYHWGVGGEVVSKKKLDVNFARNDILSTCPVWRRIVKEMEKAAGIKRERAPVATEETRQMLGDRIASGELAGPEVAKAKVITAVNGRHFSVTEFLGWEKYTVARRGDRPAERCMDLKMCFSVAQETLDRLGWSAEELGPKLKGASRVDYRDRYGRYVPYLEATKAFQGKQEILDEKKELGAPRVWLELLRDLGWLFRPAFPSGGAPRKVLLGHSTSYEAWTDGKQYVAYSDRFLKGLQFNTPGVVELGLVAVHEYCHQNANVDGCDHDQEFYEEYHRLCGEILPAWTQQAVARLPSVMEKVGRKLDRTLVKALDNQVHVEQATTKLGEKTPPTKPPAPAQVGESESVLMQYRVTSPTATVLVNAGNRQHAKREAAKAWGQKRCPSGTTVEPAGVSGN